MRRLFLLLTIVLSYIDIYAQNNNDLIIEHIENMAEKSEEEIYDYSELLERYWSITENPININSDDIDILSELRLISIFQVENIKRYRKEYGDFQFAEELHEVEDLDEISINIIKPLIFFDKKSGYDKIKFNDLIKYGKNKILFEINQCLNKKKGYQDIEDSLLYENPNSIYLGSPQKIYLRYNYSFRDKIEAGFVLEKDPGEYLLKNNINDSLQKLLGNKCHSGFDFFSFHLYAKDIKFIKTLAIGDYKLSFGQGLTMGSGMAFIAKDGSLLRRNKKITASKSANEIYYLRGIASTFKYKDIELSIFYSIKNKDANVITYDSINKIPLKISSLQESGLHRTYNEIMDKNMIKQQLYGLNLSYHRSNFQIGYTLHKTDLSTELSPDPNIYNTFYFSGKNLINQGIDFYYIIKKAFVYGEVAMSQNNSIAGLIGISIQPTGYIDFTILYRNYAKDYQCLYSNAFSTGSKNRNEEGWYLSTSITPAANWKFITSFNLYKSNWLKNNAYSPSLGYELDAQLNYQATQNTLLFIEFRNKIKIKNTSNDNVFQKFLIDEKFNMIRFHATYNITNNITLKNRAEYHFNFYEDGKKNSYLIYQDIIYKPYGKTYDLAFRYELFNAEQGSVYAYENDILYAFAVGGLSDKGIRTYLVGKTKLFNNLQISGKIGVTFYNNKVEIGSGLETIENNYRTDAKLQIIWSF